MHDDQPVVFQIGTAAEVQIVGTNTWLSCQIRAVAENGKFTIQVLPTELATRLGVADQTHPDINQEHLRSPPAVVASSLEVAEVIDKRAETQPDARGRNSAGEDVKQFLSGIGLSRYLPKLVTAGFDSMEALKAMEEEDMKHECGMLPGHIRLLQKHLGKESVQTSVCADAKTSNQAPAVASTPRRSVAEHFSSGMDLASAAAAKFGCTSAGASVQDLLERTKSELKQLKPTAAAAFEGAEAAQKKDDQQLNTKRSTREPRAALGPMDEATRKATREREERIKLAAARAEQAAQYDEKYRIAVEIAQSNLSSGPDLAGPDDTLAALAQLAEGSAQLVASCLSYCKNPKVDTNVFNALLEAAQQGAQRASWASVQAVGHGEAEDFEFEEKQWNQKLRRTAVQAAELAEQYSRECAAVIKSAGQGEMVNKAFCKFHMESRCHKGNACEFSHDAGTIAPLPKMSKTELECIFFAKGHCNRGARCPFAHGEEELEELLRVGITAVN